MWELRHSIRYIDCPLSCPNCKILFGTGSASPMHPLRVDIQVLLIGMRGGSVIQCLRWIRVTVSILPNTYFHHWMWIEWQQSLSRTVKHTPSFHHRLKPSYSIQAVQQGLCVLKCWSLQMTLRLSVIGSKYCMKLEPKWLTESFDIEAMRLAISMYVL